LFAKTGGRRRLGKPRVRWLDEVNKDARFMGIRKWWMMTLDKVRLEEASSGGQDSGSVVAPRMMMMSFSGKEH
jgi:hypothetical protein